MGNEELVNIHAYVLLDNEHLPKHIDLSVDVQMTRAILELKEGESGVHTCLHILSTDFLNSIGYYPTNTIRWI